MSWPRPVRFGLVIAILVVVLVLGACAHAQGPAPVTSPQARGTTEAAMPQSAVTAANTVWMGDHYFSPSRLTVKVGTTVTWRMLGSQEHDVWSLDGSFHSPTMGPGATYAHTFTRTGAFKYICLPHNGDGMYGEIVVQPD